MSTYVSESAKNRNLATPAGDRGPSIVAQPECSSRAKKNNYMYIFHVSELPLDSVKMLASEHRVIISICGTSPVSHLE